MNFKETMMACSLCPRECAADRTSDRLGWCKSTDKVKIARAALHFWEEPCISGDKGSGTIFFSNCNLGCVYCQNYDISHDGNGLEVDQERLTEMMLNLGRMAHNVNLVTPAHYISQISGALREAKFRGLKCPVVYNTNGYEKVESLKMLEGLVDIYLPDIKYFKDSYAVRYSKANRYFELASAAVEEMLRQTGHLYIGPDGMACKGLLVRHLVLPGMYEDSVEILRWIRKHLGKYIHLSVMAQYCPNKHLERYCEIDRKITREEYEMVVDEVYDLGFENVYLQELESASSEYTPPFDLTGVI